MADGGRYRFDAQPSMRVPTCSSMQEPVCEPVVLGIGERHLIASACFDRRLWEPQTGVQHPKGVGQSNNPDTLVAICP